MLIKIMAHLHFFTTTQEDFLRYLILDAIRHISREMDTNATLMSQLDDNDTLKSVIAEMLADDKERISNANELYNKFSRR